jgi:hypothetical protein
MIPERGKSASANLSAGLSIQTGHIRTTRQKPMNPPTHYPTTLLNRCGEPKESPVMLRFVEHVKYCGGRVSDMLLVLLVYPIVRIQAWIDQWQGNLH